MIRLRALIFVLCVLLTTPSAFADSIVYQIEVDGLACPFCVYGVEKQLSKLDGVSQLETDIKSGTVLVTVAKGATLDEEAVREAIMNAGFTMRSFSVHGGASSSD